MYIHVLKVRVYISAMYGSVQCDAYTDTCIHVLKVQCVRVHQQCMVVHSVMCKHVQCMVVQCDVYTLYKYIHVLNEGTCTSTMYGSVW